MKWFKPIENLEYFGQSFNCEPTGGQDGKIIWPTPTHSKDGDMFTKKWRPAREIIDWDNTGRSIFNRSKPLSQNTLKRIVAGIEKFCPEVNEFLVKINGNTEDDCKRSPKSVEEPLRTITAGGKHFALVKTNFLVRDGRLKPLVVQIDNHSSKGHNCRTTEEPISTVVSKGRHCLVQPFLSKYYGTGENVYSVDEPVHTVTTKGRHALVEPTIEHGALDIKFRMLTNDELARAHGMGDFDFQGTSAEVTKQIGNSVPRNMAKALCHAQLSH